MVYSNIALSLKCWVYVFKGLNLMIFLKHLPDVLGVHFLLQLFQGHLDQHPDLSSIPPKKRKKIFIAVKIKYIQSISYIYWQI